ncbi:hypothetical protein CSB20_14180, partial [bacterium DOLZORAL124_64_63]
MTAKWYTRPQFMIAVGVFLVALVLYSLTMGPTTDFWDCGEFITTSHIVGVPHQPGTPLYVLVGRVFDILLGDADMSRPAYDTARAINFMSAFFSALAVMFVYLIIWELSRRIHPDARWAAHVGGVVGALFLAFSETFWNNAIEAEVYGLSGFMMAFLTWLAIRWYDNRALEGSNRLLLLIIYLLGLGVGFHLGVVFAYPGIFFVILFAARKELPVWDLLLMSAGLAIFVLSTVIRDNAVILAMLLLYAALVILRTIQGRRFVLAGSALFFIGLTVHLMMLIRAAATPEPFINQTDPENFDTLLSVLRREQYPTLQDGGRKAPLLWQFQYYYNYLINQFYFLGHNGSPLALASSVVGPFLLAAVGLWQGLRRLRPLILLPLINYIFNGEIMTLVLNFSQHEVRERDYFYFAAFLFFAVFIGMGAASLVRYAVGKEGRSAEQILAAGGNWRRGLEQVPFTALAKVTAVVLVAIALLQINPAGTKFFEHDRSENTIGYEYAWNILAGLDEDAIVFTNGDNDTFPIWYLQAVEKFRPDVTVVNLSLVNLPWYVKQLKNGEASLDISFTDEEIDKLRHRRLVDPQTGQETLLMIKDFVVHDIITTNYKRAKRPVFFAVTIPASNMTRYFQNLQMEGMVYRLLDKASPTGDPVTAPRKVLENMLGRYRMDAIMVGDHLDRREAFRAFSGVGDVGPRDVVRGDQGRGLSMDQLNTLKDLLGRKRTDVFRGANATHLFGNYPAALNRAGYEFFLRAQKVADVDSLEYARNLSGAMIAFEACLKLDPFNQQTLDMYPLLLVQAYRDQEAKDFLNSLTGNVPPEVEEQVVVNTLAGLVRGGVASLAFEWL